MVADVNHPASARQHQRSRSPLKELALEWLTPDRLTLALQRLPGVEREGEAITLFDRPEYLAEDILVELRRLP